jgi:transcriptional regulator with XRE-family HTH domain
MDEASARSGLSKSFISYLENGKRRAAPHDLRNLTMACGYPLARFVTEALGIEPKSDFFAAGGNYPALSPPPFEILLIAPYCDSRPEILLFNMPAGSSWEFSHPEADITGYAISGRASVISSKAAAELGPGDSLAIHNEISISSIADSQLMIVINPPLY